MGFEPLPPLIDGHAPAACDAVVIIPARNEEDGLPATLDALAAQVDMTGSPLPGERFEILLLLNNCTDRSPAVARAWQAAHTGVALHIVTVTLAPEDAHIGMARRLLMDTAWRRLAGNGRSRKVKAILSTDADTIVAPDWIARNLRALEEGADAVGGEIRLQPDDLDRLPCGARQAYLRDQRCQRLMAELEDLLDPQAGDPWPRHLEHFGASLACRPETYAFVGGMPAIPQLEDMAFVDRLWRMDARLRHDPRVFVHTSARLDGRVCAGLSNQLRLWQEMSERGEQQMVPSAAWLAHRFMMLCRLRQLCRSTGHLRGAALREFPAAWRDRLIEAHARHRSTVGQFLGEIDCDRLIDETFDAEREGPREGPIERVNRDLTRAIQRLHRQLESPLRLEFVSSALASEFNATSAEEPVPAG